MAQFMKIMACRNVGSYSPPFGSFQLYLLSTFCSGSSGFFLPFSKTQGQKNTRLKKPQGHLQPKNQILSSDMSTSSSLSLLIGTKLTICCFTETPWRRLCGKSSITSEMKCSGIERGRGEGGDIYENVCQMILIT